MGLTTLSMVAGRAGGEGGEALGTTAVALVLGLTLFKAARVLDVYLNLRASTPGWRRGFHALLAAICTIILTAYVIGDNILTLKGAP